MSKVYAAKACTNKNYRRSNGIKIGILILLSVLALVMLIIDFINGKILWGIFWLIAMILALSYVVIRINAVYTTYLATDKKNLYMKNWTNDFLPYDSQHGIRIFREFIPAKTKLIEIPIDEISAVLIGTKNFIKRYGSDNDNFRHGIMPLEKSKDFYQKKSLQSMDLIYVSTYDDECYYMPISKFNPRDVGKILQYVHRANPDAELRINSREFRLGMKNK